MVIASRSGFAAAAAVLALAGAAGTVVYRRQQQYAAVIAGRAAPHAYSDAALVIVVDVGSSSIRASCFALVDAATGTARGRGKDAAPPQEIRAVEWVMLHGSLQQLPMDGMIDVHGEADIGRIEAAVERVIGSVLAFLRARGLEKRVCGVGFSTFVMNILGVDDKGTAVTPVYTYAGRRPSTATYARQLRETMATQGSLEDFHNRTGTVVHPAYAPAVFLRLYHEESTRVARVVKWQSISSYLLTKWMLAGERGPLPMSYSEASWAGLLDFRRGQWDDRLLALVHMDTHKMPMLQDSSVPISGLRPAYAAKWPELANVPFFLGIGDGAAANVGSKCIDASRIAVTVGTSAAIRVVLHNDVMRDRKVPKGLWCYRIGKDRVLLGGALNDGGSVYQFVRDTLQLSSQDIDARLERAAPAQHGLTLLPFFSGERAPGWRDEATCTITGLNKWTTPVDFVQAGMESVALRIAQVYSLLAGYADSNAMVVASGTALTSSRAWRQMLADAIGRELAMETHATEATSRGVAVLLGTYQSFHSLVASQALDTTRSDQMVYAHPNVQAHQIYLHARQDQETLYRKLYQ